MTTFIAENWQALAGIAATVIGGLWTIFVYVEKRGRSAASPPDQRDSAGTLSWAGVFLACGGLALAGFAISRQESSIVAERSIVGHTIQTEKGDIVNYAPDTAE